MTGVRFADLDGIDPELKAQGQAWQSATPRDLPSAALFWGVHVGLIFPDAPGEKRVHRWLGEGNEYQRGSRDPEQIRAWWRADPEANIGIATKANQILIIDVDARKPRALDLWHKICAEIGLDLGRVPRSESPTGDGGYHAWFRVPEGATYDHSPLLPGVDRPWQVPVPPSRRDVLVDPDNRSRDPRAGWMTREYEWVAGDPRSLPAAPEALLARPESLVPLIGRDVWATGGSGDVWGGSSVSGQPVLSTDPAVLMAHGVPDGAQNFTFKRLAMSLHRKGWSEGAIVNQILQIAARSPERAGEPWLPRQVEYVVRKAREYLEDPQRRVEREEEARQHREWTANLTDSSEA